MAKDFDLVKFRADFKKKLEDSRKLGPFVNYCEELYFFYKKVFELELLPFWRYGELVNAYDVLDRTYAAADDLCADDDAEYISKVSEEVVGAEEDFLRELESAIDEMCSA